MKLLKNLFVVFAGFILSTALNSSKNATPLTPRRQATVDNAAEKILEAKMAQIKKVKDAFDNSHSQRAGKVIGGFGGGVGGLVAGTAAVPIAPLALGGYAVWLKHRNRRKNDVLFSADSNDDLVYDEEIRPIRAAAYGTAGLVVGALLSWAAPFAGTAIGTAEGVDRGRNMFRSLYQRFSTTAKEENETYQEALKKQVENLDKEEVGFIQKAASSEEFKAMALILGSDKLNNTSKVQHLQSLKIKAKLAKNIDGTITDATDLKDESRYKLIMFNKAINLLSSED